MPKIAPFEAHHQRYESWFVKHEAAYISELLALRSFVPRNGRGLEIGVGSGRFAAPLGVEVGVDPSPAMLDHAAARGVETVRGSAEALPFTDSSFDYALAVTTICFVDSAAAMLAEARRVIKPGGHLIIGFIDRDSTLGRGYLAHQAENIFYRDATFFSADEVARMLAASGFVVEAWGQTLAHPLPETREIEALRPGRGECAFVVVGARNDSAVPGASTSRTDYQPVR
ncbi:MAG: class I SAM-dependent methyltransferase [Thiogranum sp.]|nr:class I SAM-dependent methyltransferase [Thiogranum sp.]